MAFSYGGRDPALLERLLPVLDVIEITPDDLVRFDGDDVHIDRELLAPLRDAAADRPVIAHGVGLSIASHDGCSATYLRLLDELFDHIDVAWHSEHLGYTTVDGCDLGTMLNAPRTTETFDLVAERASSIRRRYGRPFLLENVANVLPDPGGEHGRAAFVNALARESGCGILLDVHNLECDAANVGTDVGAYLDEIDFARVAEIHVAGGVRRGRYRLDVHSDVAEPSTVDLAQRALRRAPDAVVTYELLVQAVPLVGADGIAGQLTSLADALGTEA
jgi:uncharacterized protein (UPF0276 family)